MTKNEAEKLIDLESKNLSYSTPSLESTKIDPKITVKSTLPHKVNVGL